MHGAEYLSINITHNLTNTQPMRGDGGEGECLKTFFRALYNDAKVARKRRVPFGERGRRCVIRT